MMEKSQYKSFKEWREANPQAYSAARKKGLLEKLCQTFGWKKERKPITETECYKIASQYTSLEEYRTKSLQSYRAARKLNILDQICKDNNWEKYIPRTKRKNGFWTKDKCIEEAKKYKTRKEWSDKDGASYDFAKRNSWFEECTKHMPKYDVINDYTKEMCVVVALKYIRRVDWKNSIDNKYYVVACQNNWIDECCKHMDSLNNWKIFENVFNSAKQYKTISEWTKNNGAAYASAKKNGWLTECTKHMVSPKGKWNNKKLCLLEAQKYNNIKLWQKSSSGSYFASKRNGWFEECTAHMKKRGKK